MASAIYQIGDEELLGISGIPDFPGQAIEPIERPGIDGAAFWDIGVRGPAATLRAWVDAATLWDALETFNRWRKYPLRSPQDVIYGGISLEGFGVRFQVLAVRQVLICATAGGTGGLHSPSNGWCEADWMVKAVSVT
jgi:hypothetical protein